MLKFKVLFKMTGSIACYKACHAISRLVQSGCDVQAVASPSALQFVGTSTLEGLTGKPVVTDMYAPGSVMDHIHLMRWADLIVVAPATANFINKAAHGHADDLLHTLFMAHDFKKPYLIAPAMNTAMYQHPLTQESIQKLKSIGVEFLNGNEGSLACGEVGQGRLIEPDLIVSEVLSRLSKDNQNKMTNDLAAVEPNQEVNILITAGGTQEPIDTVRVISNLSSGKTGIELAEQLNDFGFNVTLLKSHNSPVSTQILKQKVFTSFASLQSLLQDELSKGEYTHIIHLAAVSDYSVDTIAIGDQTVKPFENPKLKSDSETMTLNLKRNPKLVHSLKSWSSKPLQVVAFKLTSKATIEERTLAVQKVFKKELVDAVVHNDLSEIDIENKTHKFTFYTKEQTTSIASRKDLALALKDFILEGERK